ncbi:MAG: hypothetical protein ACXWZM_06665 [Solirubrobacterales bacterium]
MTGPNSPKPVGAAIAATVLCSLATISCGGGDGDFASRADGICTEQALRVNGVLDDGGTPQNASEAAAQAARLLPIEREAVSRLRGVEAPRGRAGRAYRDFLAARGLALSLSERRGRAARRGAGTAYAAIDAKRDRVLLRADANAARAGLLACAERLSPSEVHAVRLAIAEIATSPDPALCSERFTANFVRSQLGGPRRCRRRQERPGSAARSVRIGAVRGIDGVYALATVVPRGGEVSGQRMRLGMLFEDGAYKADSLAPPGN